MKHVPATAALLGLLLVVAGAVPPARAQTDPPRLTGRVNNPPQGVRLIDPSPVVDGRFEYNRDFFGNYQGTVSEVRITLIPDRQPADEPRTTTLFDRGTAGFYDFSWLTPNPGRAWNGRYTAHVEAIGRRNGQPDQTSVIDRAFELEVPPLAPTQVAVASRGEEGVRVSWAKNPERDLVLYEVFRAAAGEPFESVAQTTATLTTLDDKPPPGEWRYVVEAIRRDAGEEGIRSRRSKEATVSVAAPPATSGQSGGGQGSSSTTGSGGSGSTGTTGSTAGGGTSSTSGASGGTAAGTLPQGSGNVARSGKVDLSGFGALLDGRRQQPRRINPPDAGFAESLPFTPQEQPELGNEDQTEELGADEPDQGLGQSIVSDDSERRRSLGFVAFGLLLFVMSMMGLWVKGEVKRADELETLDPDPFPPQPRGDLADLAEPAVPRSPPLGRPDPRPGVLAATLTAALPSDPEPADSATSSSPGPAGNGSGRRSRANGSATARRARVNGAATATASSDGGGEGGPPAMLPPARRGARPRRRTIPPSTSPIPSRTRPPPRFRPGAGGPREATVAFPSGEGPPGTVGPRHPSYRQLLGTEASWVS